MYDLLYGARHFAIQAVWPLPAYKVLVACRLLQASLLRVLGTSMQVGHGPVQTLCTARKTPPLGEIYRGGAWGQSRAGSSRFRRAGGGGKRCWWLPLWAVGLCLRCSTVLAHHSFHTRGGCQMEAHILHLTHVTQFHIQGCTTSVGKSSYSAKAIAQPLLYRGGHTCAKWLHDPCRLGGPQHSAQEQNRKWLLNPAVSHVGKEAT